MNQSPLLKHALRRGTFGAPSALVTETSDTSSVYPSYLWCGSAMCQARDASDATTREYLAEGEYVAGTTPARYHCGPDQIGSVRRRQHLQPDRP